MDGWTDLLKRVGSEEGAIPLPFPHFPRKFIYFLCNFLLKIVRYDTCFNYRRLLLVVITPIF